MTENNDHNAAVFEPTSDDVFGRIANRYDLLCDFFSMGIHRHWKNKVAKIIAAEDWKKLLDAGTGTGDIVMRVISKSNDKKNRTILGSDLSASMLNIASKRVKSTDELELTLKEMDCEDFSEIKADSYDCYSTSLVLKICDRNAALREAYRVLKPGGLAVTLEASNISVKWLQKSYLLYMNLCMPLIGWIATGGDKSAYKYLLNGIKEFPTAEALKEELENIGFENVEFERLSLGIVAIHKARKPL